MKKTRQNAMFALEGLPAGFRFWSDSGQILELRIPKKSGAQILISFFIIIRVILVSFLSSMMGSTGSLLLERRTVPPPIDFAPKLIICRLTRQ